ncbi:MAG TPA: spondin domain-containing protein [Dongiaceae bacterium]|nr:spondin domain-containing protein [Dongiaceae bacterium]
MRKVLAAGLGVALMVGVSCDALAATTDGGTTFTIKISSVSANDTLKVAGSAAVKAPIAPGVFLLDSSAAAFEVGKAASAELQALAEDGNFEPLQLALMDKFGARAGMFAPGLEFTVTAKPGDRLSFATMFVQSNDKFYAPAGGGLALFDANGRPVAGDLTASVRLFDAGTEIDQQPGAGADQAPRQKGANQGADQSGMVAEANDGFAYPAVSDVIRLEIKAAE